MGSKSYAKPSGLARTSPLDGVDRENVNITDVSGLSVTDVSGSYSRPSCENAARLVKKIAAKRNCRFMRW